MHHPSTTDQSRISEVFSSLQGEGLHLGERHLFIRFEECHIHCEYCDELEKIGTPMSLEEVMREVLRLERSDGPHSFVSLTGGEPLLYLPFLSRLMPELKRHGLRIHLETNGILWQALEDVIGWCDCVAMDLKPSSVTKEKRFEKEHRRFLEIAKRKEVFIKIVLSEDIDLGEFDELIGIVYSVSPNTPVFLMPVSTEIEGHEDPDLMSLLMQLQRLASKKLREVRVGPRFHKILNIR